MKTTYWCTVLAGLLLLTSCSTLEDPALVQPDEVLQLTVTGRTQILGNGRDRTTLLARVPKDAGQVDILFTTSGGFFAYNNLRTIKHFADSISGEYRYARTILRADTVKGPVYITAETSFTRRQQTVSFTR